MKYLLKRLTAFTMAAILVAAMFPPAAFAEELGSITDQESLVLEAASDQDEPDLTERATPLTLTIKSDTPEAAFHFYVDSDTYDSALVDTTDEVQCPDGEWSIALTDGLADVMISENANFTYDQNYQFVGWSISCGEKTFGPSNEATYDEIVQELGAAFTPDSDLPEYNAINYDGFSIVLLASVTENLVLTAHFEKTKALTLSIKSDTPDAEFRFHLDSEIYTPMDVNTADAEQCPGGVWSMPLKDGYADILIPEDRLTHNKNCRLTGWSISCGGKTFGPATQAVYTEIVQALGDVFTPDEEYPEYNAIDFDGFSIVLAATVTQDITLTAHFEILPPSEWEPTFPQETVGGRYQAQDQYENNTWTITAVPDKGYTFDHWLDESADSRNAERTVTLTQNTEYAAVFTPVQITSLGNIEFSVTQGFNSDQDDTEPDPKENAVLMAAQAEPAFQEGTRVSVLIDFTLGADGGLTLDSKDLSHGKLLVYEGAVTAENESGATLLARYSDDLTPGSLFKRLYIDAMPDVDMITIVAYTDMVEPYHKIYKSVDVNVDPAGTDLELLYLTTPDGQSINFHTTDLLGPDLYDMAAFVDGNNGNISLFAAGTGGVYERQYGEKTDFIRMDGQDDLKGGANEREAGYALAVGGPDVGKLTALIHVAPTGMNSYFELRTYDTAKHTWVTVPGSELPLEDLTFALIIDRDDVWTASHHWDGAEWSPTDKTFNSFYKLDANTALAFDTAGSLWKYDASAGAPEWAAIDVTGLSEPFIAKISSGFPDGRLVVGDANPNAKGGVFYLLTPESDGHYTADALPEIPANILGPGATRDMFPVRAAGLSADGHIYALMAGRTHGQGYRSSYVLRLKDDDAWELMSTPEFQSTGEYPWDVNDPDYVQGKGPADKLRPDGVTKLLNPTPGVTLLAGQGGALYLQHVERSITFDPNGGAFEGGSTASKTVTAGIWDVVDVPRPTKSGATFAGWYYDNGKFEQPWTEFVIPVENITLYAKWKDGSGGGGTDPTDEYAEDREKALKQLDTALDRMSQADYSAANWTKVLTEYENGKLAIEVAKPKPANDSEASINKAIADTIYAALNAALNRINAVPVQSVGNIQVAVSVDANTLSLGYIVPPTLVTVPKYTSASVILDKVLSDYDLSYTNTGTLKSSFYLASIYPVDQSEAKPAEFLTGLKDFTFDESSKKDDHLGEFDYNRWSGWMYSVGDNGNDEDAVFPGVGAAEWRMTGNEVMRWQFTLYGYGADLNADNSSWGTDSVIDTGNKSELTWEIASLRHGKTKAELEKLEADANYIAAIKVLEDPTASKTEINNAYNALTGKGGTSGSSGGKKDETAITTKPEVTPDKNGVATVEMDAKDMAAIVARAKDDKADVIVIEPVVDGKASKVTVELPKTSVADIAKDTGAKLTVKTGLADLSLPNAALAELAKTSGKTVSVSAEALKNKDGKATGQLVLEVKVGDKPVDSVKGGLTVKLPLKETSTGTVLMVITDEGAKILKKSAAEKGGLTALLTGSATVMVKDNSQSFTDVAENYWGRDAVNFAASHELFQGTGDGAFSPAMPMSRAMLVTVLHRLEDEAKAGQAPTFPDVAEGAWYADAVAWASANEIVTGTGAGFDPDGQISREQLATMFYRYAKAVGLDVTADKDAVKKFTDAGQVSDWAGEAMNWAVSAGLLSGKDEKTLDPAANASRVEVAAVLQRFVPLFLK